MTDENKLELISFLKDLTGSLENDNIHPKQLRSLEEFHKIHNLVKESIRYKVDDVAEGVVFEDEAKDFFKFILLAWFMYCIMKKKL